MSSWRATTRPWPGWAWTTTTPTSGSPTKTRASWRTGRAASTSSGWAPTAATSSPSPTWTLSLMRNMERGTDTGQWSHALKGEFTQNWMFAHLLLTTLLMEAVATFSSPHNSSGVSQRWRVPLSAKTREPTAATSSNVKTNNNSGIKVLRLHPVHVVAQSVRQSNPTPDGAVNSSFLVKISTVLFCCLLTHSVWQVSLQFSFGWPVPLIYTAVTTVYLRL